jgi:hypothetical protein
MAASHRLSSSFNWVFIPSSQCLGIFSQQAKKHPNGSPEEPGTTTGANPEQNPLVGPASTGGDMA